MVCTCHGEPARWVKDARCTLAGGYWRCRINEREWDRGRYDKETGLPYLRRRLRNRHDAAMYRKRQRGADVGTLPTEG